MKNVAMMASVMGNGSFERFGVLSASLVGEMMRNVAMMVSITGNGSFERVWLPLVHMHKGYRVCASWLHFILVRYLVSWGGPWKKKVQQK